MSSQVTQFPYHWHYTELDDRNFQIRGRTLFFIVVFFSIVLLITLLFLYARWVCRYQRLSSALPASASYAQHFAPPFPSQGLDAVKIKGLPITLYQSPTPASNDAGESVAECCICLSLFEDGEKVKVLPLCHHCYHSECVDRWLRTQSSCPICRASLRVESTAVPAPPRVVIE